MWSNYLGLVEGGLVGQREVEVWLAGEVRMVVRDCGLIGRGGVFGVGSRRRLWTGVGHFDSGPAVLLTCGGPTGWGPRRSNGEATCEVGSPRVVIWNWMFLSRWTTTTNH